MIKSNCSFKQKNVYIQVFKTFLLIMFQSCKEQKFSSITNCQVQSQTADSELKTWKDLSLWYIFIERTPFTSPKEIPMRGTDAFNIYTSKTIKINTLEQNTQIRHNYKLWVLLSPSKINRYLADVCCGTAQPGTVGNIKKLKGHCYVYSFTFYIFLHIFI